ncbi:hypothetical protein [Foetidibacter luteolus]|uniref:hypothetical protein n=1 Tax=Foetidibacter luteolus TaxID=2608880 RepID=UPI00129AA629|nr:hypothetical protein [Foetidibacter luteolus]
MDKPKRSKSFLQYLIQLIVLIILDYVVIRFWVIRIDPDPSVSIGLLFLIPAVFVTNIIIGVVLAFIKNQYSGLFSVNSIIASILFYFLFIDGINRHQSKRYERWKFNLNDTTFEITLSKLDTNFNIAYRKNPSYSTGFMNGQYLTNQSEYLLTSDKTILAISNEFLFGFRNTNDSIKLTKVER